MAAGAWDVRVSAVGAVLGAAFAKRGSPGPVNPLRGKRGGASDSPSAASVWRDVKARMFEEGLRVIARKVAAGREATGRAS